MHHTAFQLALRYLYSRRKEGSLSTMSVISFLGIFIGSCALALVASIMAGFEKETHLQLQSIHPEIIMNGNGNAINYEAVAAVLANEFPLVIASAPSSTQQIIIGTRAHTTNPVIALKAIDPIAEEKLATISRKLVAPNTNLLAEKMAAGGILIGQKLAQYCNLAINQEVTIWYPDKQEDTDSIDFLSTQAHIAGIFKTGIEEFDTNMAYCTFDYYNELFPHTGVQEVHMRLKDAEIDPELIALLSDRFKMAVHSWQDLYPALVAALKLEKYVMFIVLTLITLVASMNIVSLLFMFISYKRKDIAILRALGMKNESITRIFLYIGLSICGSATLAGLLTAYCVCLILQKYPFIKLPDSYYVSHLPVAIEFSTFLLVFLVIVCISFCTTCYAAKKSSSISIGPLLKGET